MSVGSLSRGFFGLVWRILEGIRRVLHLVLLLVIFGFVLAALHTPFPSFRILRRSSSRLRASSSNSCRAIRCAAPWAGVRRSRRRLCCGT